MAGLLTRAISRPRFYRTLLSAFRERAPHGGSGKRGDHMSRPAAEMGASPPDPAGSSSRSVGSVAAGGDCGRAHRAESRPSRRAIQTEPHGFPEKPRLVAARQVRRRPRERFYRRPRVLPSSSSPRRQYSSHLAESLARSSDATRLAEQHPLVRSGVMPETLVMVYAPRDREELAISLDLIWSSCQFARGI